MVFPYLKSVSRIDCIELAQQRRPFQLPFRLAIADQLKAPPPAPEIVNGIPTAGGSEADRLVARANAA
ncbi:MAG: hypothetical protein Q7U14_11745, partial [Lacisediminimonas sp.]|nr:hypothetical protein [Lacisediminimonas sp.]